MNKLQTFLWFENEAEPAVAFYESVFPGLKVGEIMRWGPDMPMPEGTVIAIEFELFGQRFVALNGRTDAAMSPAVSFLVNCDDQAEIDRYWDQLLDGGYAMACGWLTDKFGVTWQITPRHLMSWIRDPDLQKSQRTMHAMMGMVKLDIDELRRAYEG